MGWRWAWRAVGGPAGAAAPEGREHLGRAQRRSLAAACGRRRWGSSTMTQCLNRSVAGLCSARSHGFRGCRDRPVLGRIRDFRCKWGRMAVDAVGPRDRWLAGGSAPAQARRRSCTARNGDPAQCFDPENGRFSTRVSASISTKPTWRGGCRRRGSRLPICPTWSCTHGFAASARPQRGSRAARPVLTSGPSSALFLAQKQRRTRWTPNWAGAGGRAAGARLDGAGAAAQALGRRRCGS